VLGRDEHIALACTRKFFLRLRL